MADVILKVFQSVDPNGDGTIGVENLKTILKDLEPNGVGSGDVIDKLLEDSGCAAQGVIKFDEFIKWLDVQNGPNVEDTVKVGTWVIARLVGEEPEIRHARVTSLDPFKATLAAGGDLNAEEVKWAAEAKDDGWLKPLDDDWKVDDRVLYLRLRKDDEWVAARYDAAGTAPADLPAGKTWLPMKGVDGLPGAVIEDEVALLFTPNSKCPEYFKDSRPGRGGSLVDHLCELFYTYDDPTDPRAAKEEMCEKWVLEDRRDPQYPVRSIWCHPHVKELAEREFVRRAIEKRKAAEAAGVVMRPETVLLLGPPAAGKSSISRLPQEQVPEDLKDCVATLKYREEVNNDNLTNCMPGFEADFKVALECSGGVRLDHKSGYVDCKKLDAEQVKPPPSYTGAVTLTGEELKQVAWAIQWLVYLMFHHGPVRDSVAWDIIKITTLEAEKMGVYYSSVMAGNAIGRTIDILDLAKSPTRPVPHAPRRICGFWPYTSQEGRHSRQYGRAESERATGKLQGGNLDSNLVNLHFHAQQGESNIVHMLGKLNDGIKPSDDPDAPEVPASGNVDHFLMIDNDDAQPRLLFDWARGDEHKTMQDEVTFACEEILKIVSKDGIWGNLGGLCHGLHKIVSYWLPEDNEVMKKIGEIDSLTPEEKKEMQSPKNVHMHLIEADEECFQRLNPYATGLETHRIFLSSDVDSKLKLLNDEDTQVLKEYLSDLRRSIVVRSLKCMRTP